MLLLLVHSGLPANAEKALILVILIRQSNGFLFFSAEYRGIIGQPLPYKTLGFPSLEILLETIPDVVRVGRR